MSPVCLKADQEPFKEGALSHLISGRCLEFNKAFRNYSFVELVGLWELKRGREGVSQEMFTLFLKKYLIPKMSHLKNPETSHL